jgi:hypothetical protein
MNGSGNNAKAGKDDFSRAPSLFTLFSGRFILKGLCAPTHVCKRRFLSGYLATISVTMDAFCVDFWQFLSKFDRQAHGQEHASRSSTLLVTTLKLAHNKCDWTHSEYYQMVTDNMATSCVRRVYTVQVASLRAGWCTSHNGV